MVFARLTSGLLLLSVLFSALGFGHLRGMSPAVDYAQICDTHGIRLVALDHSGQPVEATHVCPDCALCQTLLPQVWRVAGKRFAPVPGNSIDLAALAVHSDNQVRVKPPARGPPVVLLEDPLKSYDEKDEDTCFVKLL